MPVPRIAWQVRKQIAAQPISVRTSAPPPPISGRPGDRGGGGGRTGAGAREERARGGRRGGEGGDMGGVGSNGRGPRGARAVKPRDLAPRTRSGAEGGRPEPHRGTGAG
eukprot:125660-Rhodomonas_salina.5